MLAKQLLLLCVGLVEASAVRGSSPGQAGAVFNGII
jgi:hypothetical protein